ncbi:MAG TPA: serine/threonine-protein kinase [Polyangiaceae bacterium]
MGRPDATTPFSPLTPGYRLDRYELLGPLAEGGMASVWIARQRGKHGFEKLVALKTILPQYASDLRFQQMFLDEARIASRIEHFNVARILDLGEEHDVLYLAMEYVDGDSLSKLRRAWKKKGVPTPTGIVLRVLADACSGLHEAHELRGDDGKLLEIVHRDVSPHNILVSVKGVAKLIDFGIAKARDRLAGETNAGVLKGKIQYMAPEQALGRKVDRRADLWAVGATLYHLLTGKPPFDADNTLGTLHLLTSGRPPLPLPPTIHPAIANLARKALTTPPEKRFSTAAEMRDAIEAAMIDAKVPATAGDVAAFVVEHLAERTAKRRQTIDIALAAAAERERVEELLKPAVERTDSGMTSVPGRTQAAAPSALRGTTSGVTPPGVSTGVDSSPLPQVGAANPRRTILVAGLVGGAIALAGVGTLALLRAPPVQAAAPAPPTPTVMPVPATTASAAVTASASAAPVETAIPVFAADSLPKAGAAPQPTAAPPAPVRVVAPAPRPPPAPKHKKTVDDGF